MKNTMKTTSLERTIDNSANKECKVTVFITLQDMDNDVPDSTEVITLAPEEVYYETDSWAMSRVQIKNSNAVYVDYTINASIEVEDEGVHDIEVSSVTHHTGQYTNFIRNIKIDDSE